jgi:hypothetical protein
MVARSGVENLDDWTKPLIGSGYELAILRRRVDRKSHK